VARRLHVDGTGVIKTRIALSAAALAAALFFCLHAAPTWACEVDAPAQSDLAPGAESAAIDYSRCADKVRKPDGSGYSRAVEAGFGSNFGRYISELRRDGLDVVLVIGGTGSMVLIINDIKAEMPQLVASIHRLVPIARIGVVMYYDKSVNLKTQPLTASSENLHGFSSAIGPCGCASWETDMLGGVQTAIDKMGWKLYAKKVIVLVGDSPPDKKDLEPLLQSIRRFETDNGVFNIVDVAPQEHERFEREFWLRVHHREPPKISPKPDFIRENTTVFKALAAAGGGSMKSLTNNNDIGLEILILAFGEQWEKDVAQFGKKIAAGGGK